MASSPPKNRIEWSEILEGKHRFNQLALQLMIDRLKRNIASGSISKAQAIDEMYAMFDKYSNAYRDDLKNIFGEW